MPLHTAFYASLLGLLILMLALKVVLTRRRLRIGIGTKGNKEMAQAMRVHANATEYIPISLMLMLIAELLGATSWALHLVGISLVVARLLHAYGLNLSIGISYGRSFGISINWLVIIGLAVFNISQSVLRIV